jgi:hypothetical protein
LCYAQNGSCLVSTENCMSMGIFATPGRGLSVSDLSLCSQVFLLSMQHGAAGLTLVRANHVFLLDVAVDPAIEQQAVVSEATSYL